MLLVYKIYKSYSRLGGSCGEIPRGLARGKALERLTCICVLEGHEDLLVCLIAPSVCFASRTTTVLWPTARSRWNATFAEAAAFRSQSKHVQRMLFPLSGGSCSRQKLIQAYTG